MKEGLAQLDDGIVGLFCDQVIIASEQRQMRGTEMGAFREHKSRITSLAVAQNDEYLASARCVCVCVASASRLPATCNLLNQM
eukprot:376764-Pelagomonas_calceolata.AAC.5